LLSLPVLALTWPSLLYAQETPERTVTAVEIVGAGQVSEVYLRELVGVRVGDRFDAVALDEAITRLLQTGQFISATYRLEEAGDGVHVTFELRTPPVITSIRFEGNAKFKEGRLKKQITVKEGAPVDKFAIRDGRDAIAAMYREEGYNDVVVSYDQERLDRTGELVYAIQEGKRVRIRKILFEGNAAFIPRQLKRQIDMSPDCSGTTATRASSTLGQATAAS
jgi:outer membrane protein insertion porin family